MPGMRTKAFVAWSMSDLEAHMNKWMEENPLAPGTFAFEFEAAVVERGDNQSRTTIEYSVIIFYVPFVPVGATPNVVRTS